MNKDSMTICSPSTVNVTLVKPSGEQIDMLTLVQGQ